MAKQRLNQPTSALDPFEAPEIRPLADDPDYTRELNILSALERREERRQQEITRLDLEGHFAAKPSGASDGPRDATLRARLTKLRALPDYWNASNMESAPVTVPATPLTRGLELLQGRKVEPEMSRQERLEQLRREGEVLADAIRFQWGVCEELKAEKSREICEKLRPHHDAIQLAIYRALQEVSHLSDCARKLQAAVILAAYDLRPDILGLLPISAPVVLGSELQHDSQISVARRFLEARGVVP